MRSWLGDWTRCSLGAGREVPGVGRPTFYIRPALASALAILFCLCGSPILPGQEPKIEKTQTGLKLEVPESVSLAVLTDLVSQRLGINVVYDEALRSQTVTVRAPAALSEEGLLTLLESALRFRGFTLVESGKDGWLAVVQIDQAPAHGAPLVLPGQKPATRSPSRVVTQVIALEHTLPDRLAELLQPFLSRPGGNLQVIPEERLVVVSDRLANVQRIESIVRLVDRPATEIALEPIAIEHGSPTRIASQVTQILEQKASLERPRTAGGEAAPSVHLVPQEESRQILALAPAHQIADVRELVATFDVPGQALVTRVYRPRHVPADQLRRGIEQLMAAQPSDTRQASALRLVVPEGRDSLVAIGSQSAQEAFEKLAQLLDQPLPASATAAAQRGNLRLYRLQNVRAADIAATLGELLGQPVTGVRAEAAPTRRPAPGLRVVPGAQPSEHVPPGPGGAIPPPTPQPAVRPISYEQEDPPQVSPQAPAPPTVVREEVPVPSIPPGAVGTRITVEPNLNALIVNADPALHAEIERLITLLDRRPAQVMLEAIVVEVTSTRDFELGVELESVEAALGNGVGHLIFTQFGLSTINPLTGAKVIQPQTGFNAAIVRPEEIPVIVHALERETNARIVSAPRILVNDHQQAVLSRVDEEPFVSTNFRDQVVTTSFSGFAQAGTTLSILPHIGEADHLLLSYEVQVNSFRGTATQAGVPPARTTNLAQSSVTIPDGWAIVVGGLVDERDDFIQDRVPFIGRLPVVGVAFRNTSKMKLRKTLFVFLRATILRHQEFMDLKHISQSDEADACLPPSRPAKHPPLVHPGDRSSCPPPHAHPTPRR